MRTVTRSRATEAAALATACLVALAQAAWPQDGPPELPEPGGLARVVDHPSEGVLEIVLGPVELPREGGHLRPPVQLVELPVDGWLHGFDWEMRDGEGRPLPADLLHHVNLIDPDARELFSPTPRRVMAAGRETDAQEIPRILGFRMRPGSRLLVSSMFSNPTAEDRTDTYLHVKLAYSARERRLVKPREVYPFYLDVMGPVGAKDFSVPPGRTQRSWEGSPAIDGRILGMGAHVHDYAEWIRLEDVTTGEVLWETTPEVDEGGRVAGVPVAKLWWRRGIRLHTERTYRLTVSYHNPTDEPAPDGGMGALGGVLLASGDAEWPPLDRRDVAYVTDLRNTLEEPRRMREHDHHGHGGHGHGGHAGGPDAGGEEDDG